MCQIHMQVSIVVRRVWQQGVRNGLRTGLTQWLTDSANVQRIFAGIIAYVSVTTQPLVLNCKHFTDVVERGACDIGG